MSFHQFNIAFRCRQEDNLFALPDKCVLGCLMKSCIFHTFLLYIFHNVVFKSLQNAITKKKLMLDNYKRNVLPGAPYSNITFLLTTVKRKILH